MKKIVLILSILLMCGCSSTKPVDPTSYNYEAKYTTITHSLERALVLSESENGVYMLLDKGGGNGVVNLLGHYDFDSKETTILNNDPSNGCTNKDYQKCSGFLEGYSGRLHYYNNKLYAARSGTDDDSGASIDELYEMSLDGTDAKKVFTFKSEGRKQDISYHVMGTVFHKGYIYYTFDGKGVKRVHMETWKEENFTTVLDRAENNRLFFIGDKVYSETEVYEDEAGTIHEKVLLEIDVEADKATVLLENQPVYVIGKEVAISYEETSEDQKGYAFLNLSTLEKKPFSELKNCQVYMDEEHIILQSSVFDEEHVYGLYLYDYNGTLLDTLPINDDFKLYFGQGFVHGNFIGLTGSGTMSMVPIEEGRFQKPQPIFNWGE